MFNTIVSRHNLSSDFLPLWKVVNEMTTEDVTDLNSHISNHIDDSPTKTRDKHIAKEVVLLCAYWWQKKYKNGARGVPPVTAVLSSYKRDEDERDIWLAAIKSFFEQYANSWDIHVVKKQNTSWYYSALSQGGIPTSMLKDDDFNRWSTFLGELLEYYDIPIPPNYEQFEEFAQGQAQNKFRASDIVASFGTEFIIDIVEGNGKFSSFESFKELYVQLQKKHTNRRSRITSIDEFRIIWELKDNDTQWDLCYSLQCPNEYADTSGDEHNTIILNGEQTIAEYYSLNGFMRKNKSLSQEIKHKPFKKYDIIFLDKRNEHNKETTCPLLNSDQPQFDVPLLLYQDGLYWTDKRDVNACQGVLCPSGWNCELEITPRTIQIGSDSFFFYPIDWARLASGKIDFIKYDGSRVSLKRPLTQEYSYYRVFTNYDWIADNPGTLLVINENNFKRCLYVMNHETKCLEPRCNYTIEYKTANTDFQTYNGGKLPDGYVCIRIKFPDQTTKTFKIFCVNDLEGTITTSKSIANVTWDDGTITATGKKTDESTTFRFQTNDGDYIDIAIINEQPSCCFYDWDGNIIPSKARVAFKDIDKYKAFLLNNYQLQISMEYDSVVFPIVKELCRKTTDNINGEGRYSFTQYAKEIVEKCFRLYGFNDRTQHVKIKAVKNSGIAASDSQELSVYRYHYDSQVVLLDGVCSIHICENNNDISGLKLRAYMMSPDQPILSVDLIESANHPGCYQLPEGTDSLSFVVISTDIKRSIVPILLDLTIPLHDERIETEERNQIRTDSIKNWQQVLSDGKVQAWNNLWEIWNTCKEFDIDYARMNCFMAISNSTELQIAFLNKIDNNILDWTDDEVIKELYRMQIEIGFAFFYLPKDISRWTQFPPACKWVMALLEKENVVANVLFSNDDSTNGPLPEPNMFVGEFPSDIERSIYNIGGMGRSQNSQQQLQWAKEETPRFALEAANGRDVWSYQPNPKCIMPYERWMMRLINYCLHYDAEDFYQRYI